MKYTLVLLTLGWFFLFFSIALGIPLGVSLLEKDWQNAILFASLAGILIFIGGGIVLLLHKREKDSYFTKKEALLSVSLMWIFAGFLGGLPFYFSGAIPDLIGAVFESVSGFTTTGSSVLTDIESLPKSILFWRSFTHYLGGLGIVVLLVAFFPAIGIGARALFQAEGPGVESGELRPKVRQTAMTLFKIYLLFTFLETFLLWGLGMTFFDALCHTFGTLATGGFSTKNASIAYYDSVAIEVVIIIFMILSAINFSLYYYLAYGKKELVWKNTEVKFFLCSIAIVTLGIAFHLSLVNGGSFWHHLRESAFQVVSLHTCTGFATADYEKWTSASQIFLLFIMIIGGSLGSTAGGIKMVRFVVVIRYLYNRCLQFFHPKGTFVVRLNGEPLSSETVQEVVGLFCLWLLFLAIASLSLSFMGLDMSTSLSATITTMSGVGPGIGMVGPMDNFSSIPALGKLVLILCMLLGRLEIYTLLVIFLPAFWKK